jgi:hypothetical protein
MILIGGQRQFRVGLEKVKADERDFEKRRTEASQVGKKRKYK